MLQDPPAFQRVGTGHMFFNQAFQFQYIIFAGHFLEGYQLLIEALVKAAVLVQHIGDAAAHAGPEVLARDSQHHHAAACHIFTAMVSHALHHSGGT